jgi:hypothetical protein
LLDCLCLSIKGLSSIDGLQLKNFHSLFFLSFVWCVCWFISTIILYHNNIYMSSSLLNILINIFVPIKADDFSIRKIIVFEN